MWIAIDFDGTIVKHDFPRLGEEVPGAFVWLKELKQWTRLILWTVRDGQFLADAIEFCAARGIEFDAVYKPPAQASTSPKCDARMFIDDRAVGCPLRTDSDGNRFVNWDAVGPMVMAAIGK